MSFYSLAVALAGEHKPDGTAETDLYLYEVARARHNHPANDNSATELFRHLAREAEDHALRLAAAAQGISNAIRRKSDLNLAREFAMLGQTADEETDEWLSS